MYIYTCIYTYIYIYIHIYIYAERVLIACSMPNVAPYVLRLTPITWLSGA